MTTIPNASALTAWRKSSYSENAAGGCVEVSEGHDSVVPVRDSKNPTGPAVIFPKTAWSSFVNAVRNGDITGA